MQSLTFLFLILLFQVQPPLLLGCSPEDLDSLLSFHTHISSPLNWSSAAAADCCQWEGVSCTFRGGQTRVNRLSLPGRALSGTISPSLANLTFLSYLNLSRNQLTGVLPSVLFLSLRHLQTLDLSSNRLYGFLQPPQSAESIPASLQILDLSGNRLNGSIDPAFFHRASSLRTLNVSKNSFTGPIPSSICGGGASPLLQILDFSVNEFSGHIFHGIGECSDLQVFRAGFNSITGWIPYDLYRTRSLRELSLPNNHLSGPINPTISMLSNLVILELHVNELTGEIPPDIGSLTNLQQLQLHTNNLNGTLPSSLTNCANLTTFLLRNNHFHGEISNLDFSKLQKLEAIDLGNNSFVGYIPSSLCLCRSLTAVRLAYNQLVGEVPPCMASLTNLAHLSLSDNYLSNVVGALKILRHCDNLAVLFMSRCFSDELMPDDDDLFNLNGFQNLQILTLGGCKLKGQIPSWISKLKKLKVLNLSYNKVTGPIPAWLGSMPSLFVLNLTQNFLTGELPREIGRMPALISDNSNSDLSYLALPFLFDSQQYNRLFNLPRGLKVGNNSLTGHIPPEIGQLKLLHILDLGNNNFDGSIPDQLSNLENLERLDMSGNHLSGEIPLSLAQLHFLASFSVANNNLEGEIPRAGQFDTFPASSFEGNPGLCGSVLKRRCPVTTRGDAGTKPDEDEDDDNDGSTWYNIPFGMGYLVGFFAVSLTYLFRGSWRRMRGAITSIGRRRDRGGGGGGDGGGGGGGSNFNLRSYFSSIM